jgi:hypothetical protein
MPGCSVRKPAEHLFKKFSDGKTFFTFAQTPEMIGKQGKMPIFVRYRTKKVSPPRPVSLSSVVPILFILFSEDSDMRHDITPIT